jgi:monofunctional biosynthetic peptidoglycan transglycosylase
MKSILVKSILLSLIVGLLAYEYQTLPDVALLKKKNPENTPLMELRDQEHQQKGLKPLRQQIWVPYNAVSEHLKRAIIISEDASFFSHKGVDFVELKRAIDEDWEKGKFKRGGSTITMQLARNLYLNPSKNPLRKLREIMIAWQLEHTLSKKRIFELYLNVVEWGPGIYGAEAVSRHYFSKPASDLNPVEAATLAALLPNPRNLRDKGLAFRRNLILTRMVQIGYIDEAELSRAKSAPLFDKGAELSPLSQTDKRLSSSAESLPEYPLSHRTSP